MPHSLSKSLAYCRKVAGTEPFPSLCILIFAVTWRIFAGLETPISQLYGDMVHYDHIAIAILGHHVYSYWGFSPDAQITPGYPLFLTLCYFIANLFYPNHPFEFVISVAFQSILSGISVYLVYQLCKQCTNHLLSFFAALAYLLYPPCAWSPTILLTETLYTFFLLLFLYTFFIAIQKQSYKRWLICGLAIGLCCTVRPSVLPFLIAPIIYAAYLRMIPKRNPILKMNSIISHCVAYMMGFLSPLIPWWIRNLRTFHHVILTDTDAGNPLLFGTDPTFQADSMLGAGLDSTGQTILAIQRIAYFFSHEFWTYLWWYTGEKLTLLFSTPWYYLVVPGNDSGWSAFVLFRLHLHLPLIIIGCIGLTLGLSHPTIPFFFIGIAYLIHWLYSHLFEMRAPSTTYA